jgi:chromosome segregation protein
VDERTALHAEVGRLRSELQLVRDAKWARDVAADEIERRDADLNAARGELDRLTGLVKQRDGDLDKARAERDRLVAERRNALAEAQRLQSAVAERDVALRDAQDRLQSEGDQLRTHIEELRASADHGAASHGAELAVLEKQLEDAREQCVAIEALRGECDRLRTESEGHRGENDRIRAIRDQLRAEAEDLRTTLDHAHELHRGEVARFDEQLRLAQEQFQGVEAMRGEGDRLRNESEAHRAESDRLRAESESLRAVVDEHRRALEQAEGRHRDELARLDEQLRVVQEQSTGSESLRGESDRLRMESQDLRAECERLRADDGRLRYELEDLRGSVDRQERVHGDERARFESEVAELTEKLQNREADLASTERLWREQHDRNRKLLESLDRLRSEFAAPLGQEPPGRSSYSGQLHESPPGAIETVGPSLRLDYPPGGPSPGRSSNGGEIDAVRSEVEDLRRQLADTERLQRQTAEILGGMGIRVRQV